MDYNFWVSSHLPFSLRILGPELLLYRRCPSCQIPPSVVHLSPLLLYSPRSVNNILEKCSTCMQTDYMLKRVGGLVHQQHSVVAFQIVIEATLLSSALAFSLGLPSYKINQFQDYAGCSTMGFIQLFCQNRSNLMQVFLVDFRWTCKCRKYWQEGIVPISVAVSSDS